ncbi:hypothetical protein [Streptomyces sp. NPDC051173]|uniref:DUF6907 domain-containing protein n=1 Tax=Streptomyces sp. NPDC051173 TaxID=3155164 RepID=UPI00344D6DE5
MPGLKLSVFDAEYGQVAMPVLAARISVDPYSDDPRLNVPHAVVEPWMDAVMDGLSPEEFAAVIGQVEAHLVQLRRVHAELEAALAECGRG